MKNKITVTGPAGSGKGLIIFAIQDMLREKFGIQSQGIREHVIEFEVSDGALERMIRQLPRPQ
jgi:nucleoside-triphosphatase THEP1